MYNKSSVFVVLYYIPVQSACTCSIFIIWEKLAFINAVSIIGGCRPQMRGPARRPRTLLLTVTKVMSSIKPNVFCDYMNIIMMVSHCLSQL